VLVDDRLREAAGRGACFQDQPIVDPALLEAPGRAETSRSRAEDEVSNLHARVNGGEE
jgi:hypothetical protein